MFSILGLLYCIPPIFAERTFLINWAAVAVIFTLLFYLRLSFNIFLGFIFIGGLMLWGNHSLAQTIGIGGLLSSSITMFVIAWIGQFLGHQIEGAKPSFLEDIQFLLIGPAWLLHFIYKKVGIHY